MNPTHVRRSAAIAALLLAALAAAVTGCSTSNQNANLLDASGKHPAGWLSAGGTSPSLHSKTATNDEMANGASACADCHGSDLAGGISKVSCLNAACHHGTFPAWSAASVHGGSAKKGPGGSSFFSCRICHGPDFAGGASGTSCFGCHLKAPHPDAPWRTVGGPNHDNTDGANTPVCAGCHFPGSPNNPANHPASPAPAGTPPGCFNNTLCHGTEDVPHPLGSGWLTAVPGFHGLTAKADLLFCQVCHGSPGTTSFAGGSASTKCTTCHTLAGAHPNSWYLAPSSFPSYVPSHQNSGNRPAACAICHNTSAPGAGPMAGAPSCFSADFNNGIHGLVTCHLNGPGGANHNVPFFDNAHFQATVSSFTNSCSSCHSITGTSPVAIAPACTVCHASGSPLTVLNCTSCHAEPPGGAAYPNVAGAHGKHLALVSTATPVDCDTCHSGLGTRTLNHYIRANNRPDNNALRVPPGDVAFLSPFPYTAQSGGPSSFDNTLLGVSALTCSAMKCHGGRTTPNWDNGAIPTTSDAGCALCHKSANTAPPQYNDYTESNGTPVLGMTHTRHLNRGATCTTCHDSATLTQARHFGALADNTFPAGAAAATIRFASYNPTRPLSDASCSTGLSGCH